MLISSRGVCAGIFKKEILMGNQVLTDNLATAGPIWLILTTDPYGFSILAQEWESMTLQDLRAWVRADARYAHSPFFPVMGNFLNLQGWQNIKNPHWCWVFLWPGGHWFQIPTFASESLDGVPQEFGLTLNIPLSFIQRMCKISFHEIKPTDFLDFYVFLVAQKDCILVAIW